MAAASNTDAFGISSKEVNADLARERKLVSFNVQELTHVIDGGPEKTKRRKELENLLYSEPIFRDISRLMMERDQTYEQAVLKSVKLFEWSRTYNWSEEDFELAQRLANHDMAMALHHTMFVPAIQRLASDEQKARWLPKVLRYEWIGTYAQTELGHGTNIMELETTATFDPERDEFIMNSPTITSMKWWPGGLGKSSNSAIVLAQLVVKGEKCGLHPFLVSLRSLKDHTPLPGITVGDIGPKMALNSIDNGFLILKNVRIPRENMLMKNAEVTRDGRFISKGVDKANYATMVLVRVKITRWAYEALSDGVTTAVRYSAVRRQSSLQPGGKEEQVLNYQSQQYKVLPALASAYAFLMAFRCLQRFYNQVSSDIMAGNTSQLGELHCQTSAVKAYTSDVTVRMLEICRQACGGHGYLLSGGIGLLCNSILPLVTVEGENSVLYQQTARYLMKQVAKAVVGEPTSSAVQYLRQQSGDDTPHLMIGSVADCLNLDTLLHLYQRMAFSIVTGTARQLQVALEEGTAQHVAWNNNMVGLIRAATVHSQVYVVEAFIGEVRQLSKTASTGVTAVLNSLCQFYALHGIVQNAGNFLASQTLSPDELELIRKAELQVMAAVRRDAVPLVDAFDLHDVSLHSALGCYDGNVYERLCAMAQNSSLNKSQVHPAYHKYLRGLIKEGQRQGQLSKL
ncbi:peroxisomal acyl-coenzyme A oxidase 1-like [Babylonia areolata]|uniref:peroxisomal acyl-coenzyme A oxidase 1-like n=1 Tax=Babylonia areolata TaxID=304850 RepID=UPI003FD4AFE7